MSQEQQKGRGSVASYTFGFALSVILTLAAYLAVSEHWLAGNAVILFIAGLAVVQLLVQLVFFLHLGNESKPRLNLLVFSFMFIIVFIIVVGSLWIMHNLDYHGRSPHETEQFIIKDEGIHH